MKGELLASLHPKQFACLGKGNSLLKPSGDAPQQAIPGTTALSGKLPSANLNYLARAGGFVRRHDHFDVFKPLFARCA
jgi:hypothetical protein